jgi:hypothetical protein
MSDNTLQHGAVRMNLVPYFGDTVVANSVGRNQKFTLSRGEIQIEKFHFRCK